MKFKNIFILAAGVFAFASCSEDTTDPVLELRQAATLNAITPADITISKDNSAEQFPDITWEKANYGSGAVVNYAVTLTNNSNQKSVVIGETGDTKLSFTNAEMNSILASIGAYPGQAYDFTVSLKSTAFDVYQNEATNTVSFRATPYDPNVDDIDWPYAYVAVGYPDWDYTKAYLIGDPDGDGVYQGYVQFNDATAFAILDGKDITKVLAQGQEMTDEGKGFVEVTLDADGTVSLSVPCNTWGVIGDATSGGWSDDTKMEYDANSRLWTVVTSMTANEFKFRANSDWTINYGGDGVTENGLSRNGANIKVQAVTRAGVLRQRVLTVWCLRPATSNILVHITSPQERNSSSMTVVRGLASWVTSAGTTRIRRGTSSLATVPISLSTRVPSTRLRQTPRRWWLHSARQVGKSSATRQLAVGTRDR